MSQHALSELIARAEESTELLPSQEDAAVIGSPSVDHFVSVGHEFLGYLIELGNLKPTDHVLEIGSGIGRIFIPLTRYLSKEGSFDGIEPIQRFVVQSNETVTSRFPNFRFQHVDFFNGFYNPEGAVDPETYRFPFPDGSFDMIVLVSVFTHVFRPVVANYLAEISRLLKPGGVLVTTAFLLNKQVRAGMHNAKHGLIFQHPMNGGFVVYTEKPEGAIAFDESDFKGMLKRNRLKLVKLGRGNWTSPKRDAYGGFQDIIIARKR